jgi:hypothetical protein
MRPQSRRSPNCGNFETLTWETRDKKNHLDVALWRGAEYTIKGKVVVSPKSELW